MCFFVLCSALIAHYCRIVIRGIIKTCLIMQSVDWWTHSCSVDRASTLVWEREREQEKVKYPLTSCIPSMSISRSSLLKCTFLWIIHSFFSVFSDETWKVQTQCGFKYFFMFLKKYFIQKWIFRHYSLPNVTHMTFYLQWNTKSEFWRIFLTSNESKRDCIKSTIQKYYKSGSHFFK